MTTTRYAQGEGLPAWQWRLYEGGHRDRRNLLLHALTTPLFMLGTLALFTAPVTIWWTAPAGIFVMFLVVALQGRGHALEAKKPEPFLGPGDVIGRILLEQWVTFPRYVLSGGFASAWRASAKTTEGL